MINTNVKRIKTSEKKLFIYWLTFLKPYHNLRKKEIEMLGTFLYYRHKLSQEVINKELIDRLLFSPDVRKNIMEELGVSSVAIFNNMLSVLRKKGVISRDNKILPVLVPNLEPEGDNFKLIFNFEIDGTK